MEKKVDLSKFDNRWYKPGRGFVVRTIWFYVNSLFLNSYILPISGLKIFLLRLFGAKIDKGCVIKPKVNIKYPWKLKIGANVWLGEEVWIDNLDKVSIGNNVCISQGAFLLCGNHNYKKSSFDLMTSPIIIKDGAWIGAKSIVCPGTVVEENVVISIGTIIKGQTEENSIYSDNPAKIIRERFIE